jgi:hypothetical protein
MDLSDPIGAVNQPVSGDVQCYWDSGFPDTRADIYIVQSQPLPMTVAGIYPRVEVND